MATDLSGIGLVLLITIVAGGIAYIGDRVGHQVGRKRLTLFGLRPKYTSTIVAVATGMLIALSVTLVALVGSQQVRTAFFRLSQLNSQINQLQAQAAAQQNELNTTRNGSIVVLKGAPVAPGYVLDITRSETQQLRDFSTFFDETVRSANQTAKQLDLLPANKRSSDADVRASLQAELHQARDFFAGLGDGQQPIFFVPIAPNNLFRGERLTFTFAAWSDRLLYANGEAVAQIDVEGGRPLGGPDYGLLVRRASDALARRGMPAPFLGPPSGFDPTRLEEAVSQLARVRGHFRLVARSEGPLYPHTGIFSLAVSLEPRS
jgi:uncharacterized protein (DUF3084 family)